jgi:hypothetical protein
MKARHAPVSTLFSDGILRSTQVKLVQSLCCFLLFSSSSQLQEQQEEEDLLKHSLDNSLLELKPWINAAKDQPFLQRGSSTPVILGKQRLFYRS